MKGKLAIIVPFRDRQDHLDVFVPHMHEFLKDKGIDYTIFIAEQTDDRPFNYGKLCNVVTKEIGEEYTYFAFHDIDMLPISDDCDYSYPYEPTHLSTNVEAHENKLPYPQYFGGVVLINREDFENANGYSNEYWGYGFEDLDLLRRLEKSGAYLEKFYDSNQTYNEYDENDILPYRIENVKIINKKITNKLHTIQLNKNDRIYSVQNKKMKSLTSGSFTITLWFNDIDNEIRDKNIFSFEGCDMGVFLSNGKYIISQIWDNKENNYETSLPYYKDKWNFIILSYDNKTKNLTLSLNNKYINTLDLPSKFEIFDYSDKKIKISDLETEIQIANVIIFDQLLDDAIKTELYYNGVESLSNIIDIKKIEPTNIILFKSTYGKNFFIDNGKYGNHLQFFGNPSSDTYSISLTDELYLPFRIEGKYKSLSHDNDDNIIDRYYEYNPDVEENADIFFHEVLTNELDYKSIGLNSLKYESVKEKNEELNYISFKIVT